MTTQTATQAPLGERRYDLDWVRISAFMLLIVFHVGMYYVTWDWHVKSPAASRAIEPLMMLSSPWRLSLLFTSFAAQLDPGEFLRVHRSHVVRVSFIAELRPMFHGDYELVLRDGQTLALSRRYKALLPPAIRDRL
jgi:LytTr DNA-binding domain-containing protein